MEKKTCKKWCFLPVIMQKHRRKSVKNIIFLFLMRKCTISTMQRNNTTTDRNL